MTETTAQSKAENHYASLGKIYFTGKTNLSPFFPANLRAASKDDADLIVQAHKAEFTHENRTSTGNRVLIVKTRMLAAGVKVKHAGTDEQLGTHSASMPKPRDEIGTINSEARLGFEISDFVKKFIATMPCPACKANFFLADTVCPQCGHILPEAELLAGRKAITDRNRQLMVNLFEKLSASYRQWSRVSLPLIIVGFVFSTIGLFLSIQQTNPSYVGFDSYICFLMPGILALVFGLIIAVANTSNKKRYERIEDVFVAED